MKLALRLFFILLFTLSFLLMAKAILINNFPDFNNFYYSPTLIFNNVNPYIDKDTLFTSQTYPPHVFIIVYPLQFLPLFTMSKIWTIGSILSLLGSIYLLLKLNKEKITSNIGLALSSLVFVAFPTKFTLGMGQINIFILLFITLFIFYLKKNEILSGIFLFFALALKIFPIFIPLYLIFIKKWKVLSTVILLSISLFLITYVVLGWEMISYFIFKIFPSLMSGWKGDYYNQSLSGMLVRTGINLSTLGLIRLLISTTLLILTFFIILKNKSNKVEIINLIIGTILTLNVLLNNFSWQHHFVWLIPPFFFTFFYLKQIKASYKFFVLLGFSYFLVAFNLKSPEFVPIFLISHVFWGAFILLIINLYLLMPKRFKSLI